MNVDKFGRYRVNGKLIPFAVVNGRKHCGGCNKNLPIENFYKKKGGKVYNSQCKLCTKKRFQKWISENKEYYRNKSRLYRLTNPLKIIVRNSARSLGLVKTECIKCGSTKSLEFHHQNYSDKNDVIILCRKCHMNYHKSIKKDE